MSLVGSEGGAFANAKRHRERCDLISGYPIARCVVVRSKASAPYPLGNVTGIADDLAGPQSQTFAYDSVYRLTQGYTTGGTGGLYNKSYTYDATTGNLSSKAGVSYGYQDTNHFHAVTHLDSVQKYWYDANGNMTERIVGSDSYELTYDADNRLVEVEKNQTTVGEYVYDGDGSRVKSVADGVTTYYVGNYYEWRVETSGSTGVEYYYAGSQRVAMRVGTTLSYLFGDHLGSTSITTDASGNLSGELRYLPFGETRYTSGQTPTSFRYTGQREDSTINLYWMGSRWYDSALGRFLSPDSIVPDRGNPQGLDRYAYVANNPISRIDSSGHCWGIASGIRGLPSYGTTCNNIDMAMTIVKSEETTLGQKALAGGYVALEGAAHVALVVGSIACASNPLACVAGAKGTVLGETAITAVEGACADGDCKNEAQAAGNFVQEGIETINSIPKMNPYLDLGTTGNNGSGLLHILERHASTANTNASHFGSDITVSKLYDLIKSASSTIDLWAKQGNSYIRDINVGSVVGTDIAGQTTTWMRVVVDFAGRVITSYPVSEPAIP